MTHLEKHLPHLVTHTLVRRFFQARLKAIISFNVDLLAELEWGVLLYAPWVQKGYVVSALEVQNIEAQAYNKLSTHLLDILFDWKGKLMKPAAKLWTLKDTLRGRGVSVLMFNPLNFLVTGENWFFNAILFGLCFWITYITGTRHGGNEKLFPFTIYKVSFSEGVCKVSQWDICSSVEEQLGWSRDQVHPCTLVHSLSFCTHCPLISICRYAISTGVKTKQKTSHSFQWEVFPHANCRCRGPEQNQNS